MDKDAEKFGKDLEAQIKARVYNRMRNRGRYEGLIPGAVILSIGVIFLLDHFGVVNAGTFWKFWPVIVIFVGLVKLADSCGRLWGIGITVFGVLLLLNNLGYAHLSWGELWPMVLIAVGAMAMWSAVEARKAADTLKAGHSDVPGALNESAIFGGIQKRVNARDFRGGQLQSLFGGIEVDLRDADMDTPAVVLHANAVFGGIEIRVPDTWYVETRGQGVFGGYTDSTRYNPPVDPDKPKKTLIVMGMALFGGVEIRN